MAYAAHTSGMSEFRKLRDSNVLKVRQYYLTIRAVWKRNYAHTQSYGQGTGYVEAGPS